MNNMDTSVIAWINTTNVVNVAKTLLTSKKMIIHTTHQHLINDLLSVLSQELHFFQFGVPNEKIFLFKTDLLEQNLISLLSCVKEIVLLLKPEMQQRLQSLVGLEQTPSGALFD